MPEYLAAIGLQPIISIDLPSLLRSSSSQQNTTTMKNIHIGIGILKKVELPIAMNVIGKPDMAPPWVILRQMPSNSVDEPSVAIIGVTPKSAMTQPLNKPQRAAIPNIVAMPTVTASSAPWFAVYRFDITSPPIIIPNAAEKVSERFIPPVMMTSIIDNARIPNSGI